MLQNAIFNSASFSSIATDAKGVIQIFNVGAEQMLGYAAAEVLNKVTPADISDPREVARLVRAALGQSVLLVALTGYAEESDRLQAMAAGFDTHMTKPVDIEKVVRVLDTTKPGALGREATPPPRVD